MSRLSYLVLLASATASAGEVVEDIPAQGTSTSASTSTSSVAPPDLHDQGIGASIGMAGGGRVTVGGLRVRGHFLYQLSDSDWFDGTAAFTFGSGTPACFRDRMDDFLCDHGVADGFSAEVGANVRRFFGSTNANSTVFWPYAKAGLGVAIVRFADDKVTGLGIPFHLGGGMRISMSEDVAVTVEAAFDVGVGLFGQGLGLEPQLGGSLTAGAEFGL